MGIRDRPMIRIQRAGVKDFLKIAELDRAAWGQNRNSEFIPDGEHAWRLWVEHGLVYAAKEDEKIIGAILAFPCLSEEFCIHKVFVKPGCRKMKIGTRLFIRLLSDLDQRGVPSFLTVDPLNKSALALYMKWGFTERTFVKGFYRKNEDRLVLKRRPLAKA